LATKHFNIVDMKGIILLPIILILTVNAFKIGDNVCVDTRAKFVSHTCGAKFEIKDVTCVKGKIVDILEGIECINKQKYSYVVLKTQNGKVILTENFELIKDLSCTDTNLTVYYVNQLFDTSDLFDGSWASGPTSAVMAIAYFGAIKPHPFKSSSPTPHDNLFGYYDWAPYTSFTGYKFAVAQPDPNGRPSYGAFGHCTDGGVASPSKIQDFILQNGLDSTYYNEITLDQITAAVLQNHPVILSTQLISTGHQILVRGVTCDNKIIVNDPWGDATQPDYGSDRNGAGVIYPFGFVKPQWAIEVFPSAQ